MITQNFRNRLEQAYLYANDAETAVKIALTAYKESKRSRSGSIDDKVSNLQGELDIEKLKNAHRPQLMANAISQGDVDMAVEIEKEIKESNEHIAQLEHKVKLFSEASVKADPELYAAVIHTYRARKDAVNKTRGILKEVVEETGSLIDELEKIRREASDKLSSTYKVRGDSPDTAMITLVEGFEGVIDVKGHTCGSVSGDGKAKQRYILGNVRGIENTPAGRKLTAQLAESKSGN